MIFTYLLLLAPLSLALAWFHAPPLWVFVTAAAAIVPLAEWIRRATEQMARRAGTVIGGLLNVSFGNTAEFILALFVLGAGKTDVVKATITGSIIGNSLLGLGVSILVGSWGRDKQSFKRERAGLLSSLLILSVIALTVPAFFDYTERGLFAAPNPGALDERLSLGASVALILVIARNPVGRDGIGRRRSPSCFRRARNDGQQAWLDHLLSRRDRAASGGQRRRVFRGHLFRQKRPDGIGDEHRGRLQRPGGAAGRAAPCLGLVRDGPSDEPGLQ